MAMKCIICSHPDRLRIDREIVSSGNIAQISKNFGVSYPSLYSHSLNHVTRQLATAMEKKELEQNFDLLGRIDLIISRAEDIFHRNYDKGADVTALKALDSQRNTIELLAKISYSLHQAKLAEIELMNQQSGANDNEVQQEFQESLSVLTMAELEMLQKLQLKLQNQNHKMIIIPDQPNTFELPRVRTRNDSDISFEEETSVKRSTSPSTRDIEPSIERWEPRPGQRALYINGIPQQPYEKSRENQRYMDD